MKKILFALGLAAACASSSFAGETLQLKRAPERDFVLKNSPPIFEGELGKMLAVAARKTLQWQAFNMINSK